jgi:hypothetical protein
MSMRSKLVIVAVVAVIGVVAIASAIGPGVRGYLADNYTRVGGSGESVVYRSPRPPRTVYDNIRAATSPSDTLVESGRYFLRYSDDIVAITSGNGGSTIYLDDEDRGFQRWYPVLVPIWGGPFRGPGGLFRGGGPGFGK